jgi:hypothetical protein
MISRLPRENRGDKKELEVIPKEKIQLNECGFVTAGKDLILEWRSSKSSAIIMMMCGWGTRVAAKRRRWRAP